jgi:hypothetical protein
MNEHESGQPVTGVPDAPFDVHVAHPARVYDYWLGGKDNYPADREAAEGVIAVNPAIVESVRSNRAFLARTVRYLVVEAGIRQILDVGTGLPSADNVHEVAQATAATAATKVVYIDNDPIVAAHANALLTTESGTVDFVRADLRDPAHILREAARTLDLSQPVALMILMTLQFISDEEKPRELVRAILDELPPGSYLVVSQPATDPSGVANRATARYNQTVSTSMTRRTHEEIAAFFDGLELVEPGVVTLHDWRPDDPASPRTTSPAFGGVGRKP